jgi:hypothetical protein
VTDRSAWSIEQQVAHERGLREQREAWEKRKKYEKEEAERRQKQAGLEANLRERAKRWEDYTGSVPTPDQLRSWREEYVAMRAVEEELEREERRQRAIDEAYDF